MELHDAIDKILDGRAVLFAGSGFSLSAKNNKEVDPEFLSAHKLAALLYKKCGIIDHDNDLANASSEYIDQKGEHALISLLKQEFTAFEISPEQEYFGALNWERIYTTNYDNVIEEAYKQSRKLITPITLSDRPNNHKNKTNLCIHINGYIDRLTPETLNNEFKLTNTSYLSQLFHDSEWSSLFRSDLKTADAIFFVGFSMRYDLDLQRIVYGSPELREKCFFIVAENESPQSIKNISKFGTPCPIGINAFVDKIKARRRLYTPTPTRLNAYLCFKQPQLNTSLPSIQDSDVLNLLVKGDIDEHILDFSLRLSDNYPYYIYRSKLDDVVTHIENGHNTIVIHSDLGNGKTLFTKALAILLARKGYSVYEYYRHTATVEREVERICKINSNRQVIVIDNETDPFGLLQTFKLFRTDQIIILSTRSHIYDVTTDRLQDCLGDFNVYDLNRLNDDEVNKTVSLFEHYGLWGRLAGSHDSSRTDFITTDCKRELRNLLLALLQSPHIISRFNNVINSLRNKKGFYDALIFMLISKTFGFRLELDELVYTLDNETLNNPSFEKNPEVREFVDFERGEIIAKSAILAEVILSKVIDSTTIIDSLILIFKRLNQRQSEKASRDKMKSLLLFSSIQRALNKEDAAYMHNILRYYESIKGLDFCARNPHFWLQYAIVRLSEKNYLLAGKYFETAYSLADSRDLDTYQIDNHYTRYILENEIENGEKDTCMEAFSKAHMMLMDPSRTNDVKHYPYRVAQKYYPFYQRFYAELSPQDKKKFVKSCYDLHARTILYLQNKTAQKRREVSSTKQLLEQILNEQKAYQII